MIKKIVFITIVLLAVHGKTVYADSYEPFNIVEDYSADIDSYLRQNDAGDLSISKFVEHLKKGKIKEALKYAKDYVYKNSIGDFFSIEKTLINLIVIILVSSIYTNIASAFSNKSVSNVGFYICYMIIILMLLSAFDIVSTMVSNFIKFILGFVAVVAPTYFVAIAVMGQVSSLGFYQLTMVLITIVEFVFLTVSLPLCKVYLVVSLVNNISKDDFLSRTTQLIYNCATYINRVLLGLITGLNIIQGLILPSIDNVKNTSLKKIVTAMPYIGNGVNAVNSIIFSSANLIKNSIGTYAIVIICIFCAVPYIKIVIYSFSSQCLNAMVQPVADKRIIDSISCFNNALKLLIKILLSVSALFIICIAIAALMTNRRE